MNINDVIGSIGVMLMLIAFILNINDTIDDDDLSYILLNLVGGIIAFIASYLISYYPFMVLEATWSMVSLWALYIYFKQNKQ